MLKHKKIIITGAAMGLGKAFAEAALGQGATVFLLDVNASALQATYEALSEVYSALAYHVVDITDAMALKEAMQMAQFTMNGIDGLVNNAALATNVGGMSMDDISIDLWERVLRINVIGLWQVTTAALPYIKQSPAGKIVNLASDTALWGAPRLMSYVASKGAVIAMTKSMARELGEFNICVNAVAPGLVCTESTAYVPKQRHDLYEQGRALSRPQYPNDVSGAVLFLLSDHASFITGQVLPVNGGFIAAS